MQMPDPYVSPFTWRYGTPEMRRIWSELYARRLYRHIWVALARVQSRYGLVTPGAGRRPRRPRRRRGLRARPRNRARDPPRRDVGNPHLRGTVPGRWRHHPPGRDVDGCARQRHRAASARRARPGAAASWTRCCWPSPTKSRRGPATPCIGFTHIQPAEPTTIGYRLAFYAQDILADRVDLVRVRAEWRGKGFKGAVGTSASYKLLMEGAPRPRSSRPR